MINNIYNTPQIYSKYQKVSRNQNTVPSFTGVQTLTHTNIGSCMEGYIGKIRVRKASDKSDCYLNVFKKYTGTNEEKYSITNDFGDLIGEMKIKIKKIFPNPWEKFDSNNDPSHVFVDELRNFSRPDTPYYKPGLEYMKDIGTRFLQIAQRRSDESMCCGNIKLITKGESKDWYLNYIGMTEEFPAGGNNFGFKFRIGNPNSLILPPHSKEPLSRLQGGL